MAFKMRGFNPGSGTGMGGAFKKDKVYGGERTWKEGEDAAKRHDTDLNKMVAERKKYEKGTPEYNKIQNRINQALGSSKRHSTDADRVTSTKKSDKVVVNTEEGKDKSKTTYYDTDKKVIKKEKNVKKGDDGTKKTVVKYDKDGNVIREGGYTTGAGKSDRKTERQNKKADRKAARETKKEERRSNRET